ncbi:MAG: glycosyltransferase family 39 protein [Patescibacteria group bacterium]
MTRPGLIAAGIIITSLILAITSFWNDSLIVDEIPHVGSGYSYIKKLDYRLNPEHPPLAKALAAMPLLFLDLKQNAFETRFWLENINGQWDFGRSLVFQSDNNADLITKTVKFSMLLFFVLAAVLIYKWTQKLYGRLAALTALALFSFSPTVLAHSRFVTTDLPALFGVIFATYFFIKYLESQSQKNLWLAGIVFGVAMLTKFSTFLLIPYFLILAFIYGISHDNKKLKSAARHSLFAICIFAIGFILIVWPVYYLFTFNYPPERQLADTQFLIGSYGNETLKGMIQWMADKPAIRALEQYALGLLMATQRSSGGNTTYFLGEVSNVGWRYYFPVVYALKEPLAWFILVIIALIFLSRQVNFKKSFKPQISNLTNLIRNHFTEFAMLLWLIIYWTTSIESNLNIGVRHLLPTYPFAIILVSGQLNNLLNFLKNKKNLFTTYYLLLTILFTWYVYENILVWPYYLTYFNQLAGGPSGGYRYVVDSNLDWGQDLKRLSQWAEENNVDKIHLDYFGWSDPVYYLGPKFQWLTAGQYKNAQDFINQTGGGYLAVSGTFYMNSRQNPETSYAWLDGFKPVAVIGNSIWVWKF